MKKTMILFKILKSAKQKSIGLLIRCFIVLLLLSGHLPMQGQNAGNPLKTDSLTLELYHAQDWEALIDAGKAAIKSGFDYYYMQMRVGIAYYELGKYRQSIPYFEEAIRLNPLEKVPVEYLYFAYLMGGQPYHARIIESKMSREALDRNKIGKPKLVEEVYMEGGPGFAGNQNLKQKHKHAHDTIYNSSYYYKNLYYAHVGVQLRLSPAISLYQGYGYVEVPIVEKTSYMHKPVEDFEMPARQHEYYGNLKIALPGNILVIPAFHYLWLDYGLRVDRYEAEINNLVFDTLYEHEQSYLAALSVRKDISLFAFELSASYGDFPHSRQQQGGMAVYTYPLGNAKLYTRSELNFVWNDRSERWIFDQQVGFAVSKKLWMEAEFTLGDLRDYAEKNAFVIYNSPEKINHKLETTLFIEASPHLELSLKYRYMQRENQYLNYTSFEDFTFEYSKYPFHTLIGGIKWKF